MNTWTNPASHAAWTRAGAAAAGQCGRQGKAFFAPAATAVLDNSDAHNALAAALAALSGIIEVPKQRRCAPGARGLVKSVLTA